jgi:hypothetical protein
MEGNVDIRKQLIVFAILLGINALLAFLTFALGLQTQAMAGQPMPDTLASVPAWLLGLANAGLILVLYGLLGLSGFWLARRLGLPGIFRKDAGWRAWILIPMGLGVSVGVVFVVVDRVCATIGANHWEGFSHPGFPMSLIASASAGIGEEIIFRLFVLSLWAFLLNLIVKRWGATDIALWIANGIAALAFAASHLPVAMMLLNMTSPLDLPVVVLVELLVLNGLVALVAGERYMHDGLVAAAGVHFWTDIVWHVIWPLL